MADVTVTAPAPDSPAEPAAHRHHVWPWLLLAAAAVIAAALVANGTKGRPPAPPPPPVGVTAATAITGDLPVHVDAIGTVTPLTTATIISQVSAQIEAVHFTEGQAVQRGTALFALDQRPFRAVLQQALGALRRDEQVLAQSQMDLARFRDAWARNAIAKQQLDDQEHIVAQNEGTVETDRGAVAAARVNVDYCSINSPITGRVGLRLVDPGNVVTIAAGTALAVVTQLEPISVVFAISEDDLQALWRRPDRGQGALVTLFDRARTHQLATGQVMTIDNQIDTTTGTVRVRAVFANNGDALFPNQFVNAQVLVNTLRGVVIVPTPAVQRNGDNAFVFAIVDGRAHTRPIRVGASDSERTQVTGIDAGTVVATSSFDKLREGAEVAVQAQPSSTAGPRAGP
jgi:multidrug efflux system membrane fusion protein